MQVLFVNPSVKKETQPAFVNKLVFSSLPLGLGYVAGYLRKKQPHLNITVVDEIVEPLSDERLADILSAGGRVIAGISCLTATFSRAIELAAKLKSVNKEILVVFGGAHCTALPDESLATGVVDVVVRNEGEETMDQICDIHARGGDFSEVAGISYVRAGAVRHNPPRALFDLGILPPFPYDLFEKNILSYSDFGVVLSSRGCPFDCIFCSNRIVTGRSYRVFGTVYVVDQIKTLVEKYGQKIINFVDDDFVGDKKRFYELTNAIIDAGLHRKVYFTGQLRGKSMSDAAVLDQMKKVNFRKLTCGLETASEQLMLKLNKAETVGDIKKGIRAVHEKGFQVSTTFIYGIPGESRKDRRDSLRLARSLPLDSVRFNIATPYPGTRLFEIAKTEGKLNVAENWRNFNVQYYLFGDDIPYVPESAGRYELIFDTIWANFSFYFSLRTLTAMIFKTREIGGGVIPLKKRRDSMEFCRSLASLAALIAFRFVYVFLIMLKDRLNLKNLVHKSSRKSK